MASSINKGFTLIEAMLSMAILLLLGVGSVAANRLATAGVTINELRSQANILAVEGVEAVMSVRAENFLSITSGVFHPVFSGSVWTLSAGPETIGKFTRSITISPVQRALVCFESVCDITDQGGITDENSFKSEVKVTWKQSGETKNLIFSSLITYWR